MMLSINFLQSIFVLLLALTSAFPTSGSNKRDDTSVCLFNLQVPIFITNIFIQGLRLLGC